MTTATATLFPAPFMVSPTLHRASEFFYDTREKRWITGACGPTALAAALTAATGRLTTPQTVMDAMNIAGLCDSNGVTNAGKIATAASTLYKLAPRASHFWTTDYWSGWRAFLVAYLRTCAIVCELANGQALVDFITGLGENARNLRYHFIAIVGYHPGDAHKPEGIWVADGDSFATGDRLQFIPLTTFAKALPCAMVALPVHMTTGGSMAGTPPGWSDDGATLRAPSPHNASIVQGFRQLVRSQTWFSALQPVGPAYGIGGPNTRQDFALSTAWDGKTLSLVPAPDLVHADQLHAAQTRVSELTAQVTTLHQQVAQLQAALAAAKQQQPMPAQSGPESQQSQEATLALALFRNAVILYQSLLRSDSAVQATAPTPAPAEAPATPGQ